MTLYVSCRYFQAFFAYTTCNLVLGVSAAALCAFIAPAAAGSGIPEVKAYLNGIDAHSMLAPSTLFVKVKTHFPYLVANVVHDVYSWLVTYLHLKLFLGFEDCWIDSWGIGGIYGR